jgi:hypothetical protein
MTGRDYHFHVCLEVGVASLLAATASARAVAAAVGRVKRQTEHGPLVLVLLGCGELDLNWSTAGLPLRAADLAVRGVDRLPPPDDVLFLALLGVFPTLSFAAAAAAGLGDLCTSFAIEAGGFATTACAPPADAGPAKSLLMAAVSDMIFAGDDGF